MDAISRQPEITGKATGLFLMGAALSEAWRTLRFVYRYEISRYVRIEQLTA